MKIKFWASVFVVGYSMLLFFLGVLVGNLKPSQELKNVIVVESKFVQKDSVEITIEQFLAKSVEKGLSQFNFIRYCDANRLEYSMRDAIRGFCWYTLYANDKQYAVGFSDNRMFNYHQQ